MKSLAENEALRLKGWSVFRSATRDHMIPITGLGANLLRVKIGQALPALGVTEGVSASDEERSARASSRLELGSSLRGVGDQPLGIMQYFSYDITNTVPGIALGVPSDTEVVVGVAPYDGWLREVHIDANGSGATLPHLAIRTSGGGSFFRGFSHNANANTTSLLPPDFVRLNRTVLNDKRVELRGGKVPVFAGENIIVVIRDIQATPAGVLSVIGLIGIEAVVLARAGSSAANSQYLALTSSVRLADRQSASDQSRIEVEKLRLLQQQEATTRARVEATARAERPAASNQGSLNPFGDLLVSLGAQAAFASRQPPPPSPPRVPPPPPEPPAGAGQTFVSAWNPSFGYIGYLIPDPPRGGKVSVFDNKYTVWDISGRNVGSGQIIPVTSDSQIPPGARLSPSVAKLTRY